MKFTLDVEIDSDPRDAARELRRLLRYWSNQITVDDAANGTSLNIYDSGYRKVGHWAIMPAITDDGAEQS